MFLEKAKSFQLMVLRQAQHTQKQSEQLSSANFRRD